MKQNWMDAGELLRYWMGRLWTCRTLAPHCQVSAATINRWCLGTAVPSELAWLDLSDILPADIRDALAADWWGYTVTDEERAMLARLMGEVTE